MSSSANNIIRLSRLALITKCPLLQQPQQASCQRLTLQLNRTIVTSDDEIDAVSMKKFKLKLPKDILARVGDDFDHPNGYRLFNLEPKYKIDVGYLKREMHKLQNLLHPDRYMDQSAAVATHSDRLSSIVNDFYRILSNPYERGKYLLGLITNKSEIEIEETLDKLQLDSEFLAKMMEISEKIYCPDTDQNELSKLEYDLEHELNGMVDELNKEFEAKNIDNIVRMLGTLKFVANCYKALVEREDTFSKL